MSKTTILYRDVAPGAEDDASVSTNGAAPFADLAQLPHGLPGESIATCELNQWGLGGDCGLVDGKRVAFWSTAMSGADGVFLSHPVITVTFDQQYTTLGVTLVFDAATGGYCNSVTIHWYQGAVLKAEQAFQPTGVSFFCSKKVSSFNKIVITLNRTNLPYRYARLTRILFGIERSFDMTEIRRASIVAQADGIAQELPVSTLKWTLDSRDDADYLFQLKQPMEVRSGESLIGVYYIDAARQTAAGLYDIECYDALGVLGESQFSGGMYTAKSAKALLEEIADGHFAVATEVADTTLTGAILPCTRREAMQQVLFAWGACASTDGRESIRVFALPAAAVEIGPARTYAGCTVETAAIVTAVRVTAHTYTQDSSGGIEIGGVKYKDTETVYTVTNPNVTAADKPNVVEVTDATLVSAAIGQATAQRVYDYYQRRSTHKAKIVLAGERLGDRVTLPNAWGGTNTGNVMKLEISLSNTVAASLETLGV